MCAFFNSVIYKVSAHLSEYSALVTVYLFTILPYKLRSNVLVRWKTNIIRGQNIDNIWQFWGFRPSGST